MSLFKRLFGSGERSQTHAAAERELSLPQVLQLLGVPLQTEPTTPQAALLGGVVKAGIGRGFAHLQKHAYDQAIEGLTAVLSTGERDRSVFRRELAVAHSLRGAAYEGKQMYDKALEEYQAALDLDPTAFGAQEGVERIRKRTS